MITKFSAEEARKEVELAKKQAELEKHANQERRLEAAALRERQEQIQASIDQAWNAQMTLLIDASVEGRTEIYCDSVFKFKELVRRGLRVLEYGKVRKQSGVRSASFITKEIDAVKSKIFKLFDKFIDSSPSIVKKYYDTAADFHKLNYEELINTMRSGPTDEFCGDSAYLDYVRDDFSIKYSIHLEKLNDEIREYKKLGRELEIAKNFVDDYAMTSGEYEFNEDHQDKDILEPINERNTFKIKWASDEGPEFMSEPLFTKTGLNWISSEYGQNLLTSIFESLKGAAAKGKSWISLKFKLTNDGWYFTNDVGNKYPSCMPDDLVEIIARERFIIADTSATTRSYTIKVKW